jgi:ferric-dicitrate binding protein FerR (iron transport regulator)
MDKNNSHDIDPIALLPRLLAGEAEPGERSLVEAWASESPANRKEYEDFVRLWEITGSAVPSDEIDIDREWKHLEAIVFPVRKMRPMRYLQVAALVVFVSALALVAVRLGTVKTYRSSALDTSEFILPDGSEVTLNAHSKLTFRNGFGDAHRHAVLSGEAYFEVKKNASLPFVVNAGSARVEVTGTRFNISAYRKSDQIRVTVTEGSVMLSEAGEAGSIPLHAGETGLFDVKIGMISRSKLQNINDLSWKTGILDFRNTPLPEVIERLTNTYHRSFEVDPALNGCTVTVRFDNRSLEDILSVLKSTLGLEISEEGKNLKITGEGC